MIGVEITEINNKTKAANSKIVNGVAGRNILILQDSPFQTIVGANVVKTWLSRVVGRLSDAAAHYDSS